MCLEVGLCLTFAVAKCAGGPSVLIFVSLSTSGGVVLGLP